MIGAYAPPQMLRSPLFCFGSSLRALAVPSVIQGIGGLEMRRLHVVCRVSCGMLRAGVDAGDAPARYDDHAPSGTI